MGAQNSRFDPEYFPKREFIASNFAFLYENGATKRRSFDNCAVGNCYERAG